MANPQSLGGWAGLQSRVALEVRFKMKFRGKGEASCNLMGQFEALEPHFLKDQVFTAIASCS